MMTELSLTGFLCLDSAATCRAESLQRKGKKRGMLLIFLTADATQFPSGLILPSVMWVFDSVILHEQE